MPPDLAKPTYPHRGRSVAYQASRSLASKLSNIAPFATFLLSLLDRSDYAAASIFLPMQA